MFTSDSSGAPSAREPSASWRDYTELKEMLKALGDNARLNIVHALSAGGEVKVTDLALKLAVSQPLVSWHLAILRRHGLVRQRRSGREVYCSLDLERFSGCQRLLANVVAEAGGAGRQGATGPPDQGNTAEPPPGLKAATQAAGERARERPDAPANSG